MYSSIRAKDDRRLMGEKMASPNSCRSEHIARYEWSSCVITCKVLE